MRYLIAALAIAAAVTAGWLPSSAQQPATVEPIQAAKAMGACLPGMTITPSRAFKPEYLTVDVTTSDAPTYQVTNTGNTPPTVTQQTEAFMVTREREKSLATHSHKPDSLGVMLVFPQRAPGHDVSPQDQAAIDAYRARVIACFDQTYPWTGAASSTGASAQTSTLWPGEQLAIVEGVVDGDTVDVRLADGRAERIRLLGIDAPEIIEPSKLVQCFSTEANARAHELLDGKQVSVFADPTQETKDQYGRLLAYIWLPDGAQYNYKMVVEGYALEYTDKTPYYFQADFKAGQQAAQTKQLGLWSPSTCNGDITKATGSAPPTTGGADSGTSPTPTPTAASTPATGFNAGTYTNQRQRLQLLGFPIPGGVARGAERSQSARLGQRWHRL
jgi:micrococcal nuclease